MSTESRWFISKPSFVKAEQAIPEMFPDAGETLHSAHLPFNQKRNAMARVSRWLAPLILMIVDYIAVVIALLTAYYIRNSIMPQFHEFFKPFSISDSYFYFIIPMIYLSIILYEGLYTKRLPFWRKAEILFKICAYATMLITGIIYFSHQGNQIPRTFIIGSGCLAFGYLIVARSLTKRILMAFGLWQKPVVIVGAGKTAELMLKTFEEETNIGYKVVGFIEDNHTVALARKYPVLGNFANMEKAIVDSGVRDVMVAAPGLPREKLMDIVYRIQPHVQNVTIVPNLYGLPVNNMEVETFFNQKTIMLRLHNNLAKLGNQFLKRTFDLVCGCLLLIPILPFLLILGILVKIDSPGPVFYIGNRIGKRGREFKCYKFRTMYVNGDEMLEHHFKKRPEAKAEWERFAKLKQHDPRVTRMGRLLRKFSLDELPQIFNVIMGDMSLVGPRPYLPREEQKMGVFHDTITLAVPGITGLWQVSGRNEIEFTGRLEMDCWYVRNWSFWLDIMLLLKTVKVVLRKHGAY